VTFIPPIVRIAETITTQVRSFEFVEAARASGAKPLSIIRFHILNNVLGPILVYATSLISISIILAAGLSFLGLGVTPPDAEWGLMLISLRQAIWVNPLVAALPGAMIFITSMCFNLMSDGLRSAMDVRLSDPVTRAEALLEVRNLKRYFPIRGGLLQRQVATVQAVDDISFELRRGETLGIVGESGCGKSTTARLLIRLIEPDGGAITFDGRAVGTSGLSVRDLRRQVQMVFQDSYSSLNPRCTIEDTIAYGPSVHGLAWDAARRRAREILAKVGLDPALFAARYPHELSGGQRQRVNIARALALEPKVVVLDEPVSALDKSIEAQVLNLLIDLKRDLKLTYVFISHDLNVVQYMSDRVLVMYLGKVVEYGPVESIDADPRPPYPRALLGAMPSMDPDRRGEQATLTGDPPNPIDPPPGCRFHTRCPHAEGCCAAAEPRLAADASVSGHDTACHMLIPGSGHSVAPLIAA